MANLMNFSAGDMEPNIKDAYNRLSELYDKWYCSHSRKDKDSVEDLVFNIINNRYYIPDDVYLMASNGSTSGLCQHGSFERDILKLIDILKTRLQG